MFKDANEFAAALTDAFKGQRNEYVFTIEQGRKYSKMMVESYGSRSVYCFIDADGNVYKAASINAPAKGIRATLATLTPALCAQVASTGYASTGWLYR